MSVNPSTEILLTNALYFKGSWQHAFDPKLTKGACFHVQGVCKNVAMMDLRAQLNYAYVEELRAHALELPYEVRFLFPSGWFWVRQRTDVTDIGLLNSCAGHKPERRRWRMILIVLTIYKLCHTSITICDKFYKFFLHFYESFVFLVHLVFLKIICGQDAIPLICEVFLL